MRTTTDRAIEIFRDPTCSWTFETLICVQPDLRLEATYTAYLNDPFFKVITFFKNELGFIPAMIS